MWLSVVCTLVDNDTRHYSGQKCCATNWATSPSARFALVIEYVSSIHPWAKSTWWISQSKRALCFSYVILFWRDIRRVPKTIIALEVFVQDKFMTFHGLQVYAEFRRSSPSSMLFYLPFCCVSRKVDQKLWIQICCEKSWSFSGNTSSKTKICCRK